MENQKNQTEQEETGQRPDTQTENQQDRGGATGYDPNKEQDETKKEQEEIKRQESLEKFKDDEEPEEKETEQRA